MSIKAGNYCEILDFVYFSFNSEISTSIESFYNKYISELLSINVDKEYLYEIFDQLLKDDLIFVDSIGLYRSKPNLNNFNGYCWERIKNKRINKTK